MMRGDVDRPDLVLFQKRNQGVHLEAFVVDRERLQLGAGQPERGPGPRISQSLHADHVPR